VEPSRTEGNSEACPGSHTDALDHALRLLGSTGGLVGEARTQGIGLGETRARGIGFGETSGTEVLIEALMHIRCTALFGAIVAFGCSREPAPTAVAAPSASPSPAITATASATPSVAAAVPAVGDPAPQIVATASNGQKIDLTAMKGKHVVVYFYPKDDTPGCTKEACAFRDAWAKLEKASIVVVGVSHDDDASHKAFAEKHKLPFALVADNDGSIAKRFAVPEIKPGIYSRVSYLVGPDGKIKKIYPKVDPGLHADEILEDAK